ncbi:MAG: hypothetical protein ACR2LX_14640 [Jatrophihabitans sp.]
MSVLAMRPSSFRRRRVITSAAVTALRIAGAGLLATNAGIHAYLWDVGYRSVPTIGTLFLLNATAASVLTVAVLGVPRRWLPVFAALGALLELGTVGGLILTTLHGLFGFVESARATLYWQSAITEIAGAVILAALAGLVWRQARGGATTSWW